MKLSTPPNLRTENIATKEEKAPISAIKAHRLIHHLKDCGYSISDIEKESGIDNQTLYKWNDYKSWHKVSNRMIEQLRIWLRLPKDEIKDFFEKDDYHPERLLEHRGKATDIEITREEQVLSELQEVISQLSLNQLPEALRMLASVLESDKKINTGHIKEPVKVVELTHQEKVRLRNLVKESILLSGLDQNQFQEKCSYTPAVQNILDENETYNYPKTEIEPLLPNLVIVTSWVNDEPDGIKKRSSPESIEELKNMLAL